MRVRVPINPRRRSRNDGACVMLRGMTTASNPYPLRRVAATIRAVRAKRGWTLGDLAEALNRVPGAPEDFEPLAIGRLERTMSRDLPGPAKGPLLRGVLAALDIPLHPVLALGGAWPPLAREGGPTVLDQCLDALCSATGYTVLHRWQDGRIEIGPKKEG
jgi:hypothetical protein